MAYETGSATDLGDLATKINTFLTGAPGWTSDQLDTGAGKAAWSKGTVFVQARWQVGVNTTLGLYQSLAFIGTGTDPGAHTDDSGNGAVSGVAATIAGERHVGGLVSPFTAYHFFAFDDYFWCALEYSAGFYRHFGWGDMGTNKIGDGWTGGEFVCGHYHQAKATDTRTACLADALHDELAFSQRAATMHAEGLINEPGSSKWAQVWGAPTITARPDDTATNAKIMVLGGFRGSKNVRNRAWVPSETTSGGVELMPVQLWHIDDVAAKETQYELGCLPGVWSMNMRNFVAADEFVIGSSTYMVFPTVAKTEGVGDEESYNQGIAYLKSV